MCLCTAMLITALFSGCSEQKEGAQWQHDIMQITPMGTAGNIETEHRTLVVLDPADCQTCDPTLAAALERTRQSTNHTICLLRKTTPEEHRQFVLLRLPENCVVSRSIRRALKHTTVLDIQNSTITVLWKSS